MKTVSSALSFDVRAVMAKAALPVAMLAVAGAVAACHDSQRIVVCGGLAYTRPSVPDTATLKVGTSVTATAGAEYGSCGPATPREQFTWDLSDSTILSVHPVDSIHAEIRALRVGRATATPRYTTAGGGAVAPVTITVIP